jgi:hypothetical protein
MTWGFRVDWCHRSCASRSEYTGPLRLGVDGARRHTTMLASRQQRHNRPHLDQGRQRSPDPFLSTVFKGSCGKRMVLASAGPRRKLFHYRRVRPPPTGRPNLSSGLPRRACNPTVPLPNLNPTLPLLSTIPIRSTGNSTMISTNPKDSCGQRPQASNYCKTLAAVA